MNHYVVGYFLEKRITNSYEPIFSIIFYAIVRAYYYEDHLVIN